LLSAHGRLLPIRPGWRREIFQPLVSTAAAAELIRVLNYPKLKLAADDHDELLADYLPYFSTVKMPARAPRLPSCRDPFDLLFLQLCGKADYLVTGDRDLLDIDEKLPYAITAPDAFMAALHLDQP
jgi:putative PIN family toxin of toxin-antitoxin system